MFQGRKKEKDGDDLADFARAAPSTALNDVEVMDYGALNSVDLDMLTKNILMDSNLKRENVDEMMKKFDRNTKIQICQQQSRLQSVHEGPAFFCHKMKKALESKKDDFRHLVLTLRVTLGAQNVSWIDEFGREGGFHLLVSIMSKLLHKIERLKSEPDPQQEDELVSCLYVIMISTRTCLNCEPGIHFLLRPNSQLCSKLIEALYISIALKSDRSHKQANYDHLIIVILTLLAAISFLGKDGHGNFEITGNSLLIRDLTTVAEKRKMSSRFACIIRCLHFKDDQIMYKVLVFINTLLSCIDDNDWQVRMLWRNELMSAGLKPLLPNIQLAAGKDENIRRAFNSFEYELKADYDDLLNRFENLKGDVTNLNECANMLISSAKNTECQPILQDILLRLLMVNDRKYKRATYFKMFVMCMTEIAFSNMGCGPDFGKQVVFNFQLDEALQQIENESNYQQMNKLLDSAVQAKQEALSLQLKYYKKMQEYQEECTKLRKHINDKNVPIPHATNCDLPVPKEISLNRQTSQSSQSSSIPPAPPPPPPFLLGPPKGKANTGTAPPPAPPPPPPLFLKSGGPPAPPLPAGAQKFLANQTTLPSPEIPNFLKKRVVKTAEIPMKKIAWNSNIIKPQSINKDSLWAQIDEGEIASEDVFDYLKSKFSASSKISSITTNTTKKQTKTKVPLVIQDSKMLQALAILQGSCKLSFKEWHDSLLEVNEELLNAGIIGQLRNALPPLEMIIRLKECTEDEIQNMPEGEQFIATISKITALPIRLEAIHLKLCWPDSFSELVFGITTVAEACEEILKSVGLKHFTNFVLLAGNFMGRSGKNSKDTFGFELGVLNKLVETKDLSNSETLLHGLIFLFHKKFDGRYTNFALEDFHHITKASKVDLADLEKTKNHLKNSVRKISNHLKTYKRICDKDQFQEKMADFMEHAEKDIIKTDSLWEHMQLKWTSLQTYLCFDPKKYPMERLFGDLQTFKGHYKNVWTQILKSQKAETTEHSKKAEQKRKPFNQIQPMAEQAAKMAKKMQQKGRTTEDSNVEGVLDKIEQMLEEGKYRPDGSNRVGYRIRRKGQPTVYKLVNPPVNSDQPRPIERTDNGNDVRPISTESPRAPTAVPTAVELLQRLRGLEPAGKRSADN